MEVIVTHSLSKVYGNRIKALQNVNINCVGGKIYCVLGPNGAGKTTLLRILATQLYATTGSAEVLGFDVVRQAEKIRSRISVVPQDARPISHLSPWQHVYWYLLSRGSSLIDAKRNARIALKFLELWDVKDVPAIKLSGGQGKRIIVAMALATSADVLFLDEPTAGLDPLVRRSVWTSLRDQIKNGQTIFLTTHNVEEAEMVADYVIIIKEGKIIAFATPYELKKITGYKFKVVFEKRDGIDMYARYGRISIIGACGIVYPESEESLRQLIADAVSKRLTFSVQPTDLEDALVKLVGDRI